MNKAEITKAIADKSGLTMKDSEKFLKSFTETVAKTLSQGEEIALTGFGAFSVVTRCARVARNFRTGESIHIPESKVVRVKVGKCLKDSVNGGK
ncbi:MAG: HU family DNA-binding protein [Endomicrobium sp.]|jgi:DNA-binding protein HU-beta|nr:HU family DNA-binding protein [Endomicrobium sp.]